MHLKSKKINYSDVIRIFRMVHGFSKMLTLSVAIRAISKLAVILLAVTIASLVETVLLGQWHSFSGYIVVLIIEGIITVVFSYIDTYISHDMSFRIIKILREKVYGHMDEIAPGGLNGINTVDSATIILSDINVFEWFYAHCLVEWAGTFITLLVCIVMMCQVSVGAGLVVILLLCLMMVIPLFSTKKAGQKGILMKQLFGALNGIVADGVMGSKDIVGYNWTNNFFKRLDETSGEYSKAQGVYAGRSEWEKTIETIIAGAATLAGIMMIYNNAGDLQRLRLIPIFMLIVSTVNCIQESLSEGKNFGFVFGAAARIVKILDIKAPVKDKGQMTIQDIIPKSGKYTLTFRDVKFKYDEKNAEQVLKNITFKIQTSEIVAIVSASGGGKTTIGKLLQRFWEVESGAICINDVDIRNIGLRELRDIVMVIPQETYLFHGSIRENMKLVKNDATEQEIERAIKKAQADVFINRLDKGLDTMVGENGMMLSGGERQRVALAQAFLKQSPILVLDEATSALDTENERKINEVIRNDRKDKVTIVIAHRLSSMQSADYIIFIKDGYVVRIGNYQELIRDCKEFKDLVRGEYLEKQEK